MTIYMTARFSIKPASIDSCEQAIRDFIATIKANEPDTLLYSSLRQTDNQTQYFHYLIFKDDNAREKHRTSEGVKRFTSILFSELTSDGVEFTDYDLLDSTDAIASN